MISYRPPSFQTLNFQEYCLDVRALLSERPEPSGVMVPSTTKSLWKATALKPSLGKTELQFLEKAVTSPGFVMRGIQNTARQSFRWCKLPEGYTESYPCMTWFMVLYLLKVIRPRLSHMQLLFREQETIWEGDRGCPRMDGSDQHTHTHTHLFWES